MPFKDYIMPKPFWHDVVLELAWKEQRSTCIALPNTQWVWKEEWPPCPCWQEEGYRRATQSSGKKNQRIQWSGGGFPRRCIGAEATQFERRKSSVGYVERQPRYLGRSFADGGLGACKGSGVGLSCVCPWSSENTNPLWGDTIPGKPNFSGSMESRWQVGFCLWSARYY